MLLQYSFRSAATDHLTLLWNPRSLISLCQDKPEAGQLQDQECPQKGWGSSCCLSKALVLYHGPEQCSVLVFIQDKPSPVVSHMS